MRATIHTCDACVSNLPPCATCASLAALPGYGKWKPESSASCRTVCHLIGVVPVLYRDPHWDTFLAEVKFSVVFIPYGRPCK